MESIRILAEPFSPWKALADYEVNLADKSGQYGATAVFVGTTRGENQGDAVRAMTLEHYPEMTAKELARLRSEALDRWPIRDALIIHRVGQLKPGEPIMLVAVWSAHRREAFAACEYLVEALKARAPFWKKETLARGERWVTPIE